MIGRAATSWQVILADLALILFITTLAGFVAVRSGDTAREEETVVAGTQAIYRRSQEFSLADWLRQQQPDPRLQLTIFARYGAGERLQVWQQAQDLMGQAGQAGYDSRVILEPAQESDLYAALAYDAASQQY